MKKNKKKFERVLRFYPQVALGDSPSVGSLKSAENALYAGISFAYRRGLKKKFHKIFLYLLHSKKIVHIFAMWLRGKR